MGWVKRYSPDPTIYAWEKPNGERMTAADLPQFSSRPVASGWLLDEIERRRLQATYEIALDAVLNIAIEIDQPYSAKQLWAIIRATPEQRAQAFLKAIDSEV